MKTIDLTPKNSGGGGGSDISVNPSTGLSLNSGILSLALSTATSSGAISSSDKSKLDSITVANLLNKTLNLSDISSASTARTNLGAAATSHTHDASDIVSGTLNVSRLPTGIPTVNIGSGNISSTEFDYLDGVTDGIQTQFNSLSSSISTISTNLSNFIATKDQANGLASLDNTGKISVSILPSAVLGNNKYIGTWNATTNSPTIPSASSLNLGNFYIVSVAGTTTIDGINDWQIGDWLVSDGTRWDKIDNTDLVTSVNGYLGAVVLSYTDVGAAPTVHNHDASNITTGVLNVARIPTAIPATSIGGGLVDNTEFSYLNGVTSGIQGQFDSLGSMANQDSNSVSIAGGEIDGVTMSGILASGTFIGDGSGLTGISTSGGGTVSSVGLVAPSIFNISNSPVTSSGNLTLTFSDQVINKFLATPSSGSSGPLDVRSIVVADLPTGIPATSIGGGAVDNTEFGYLDGVTSSIQTQFGTINSTLAGLGTASTYNVGTTSGQIPVLVSGDILPNSVIPQYALVQFLGSVADQTAMLAQSAAGPGDWCVRSDLGTVWVMGTGNPNTLSNWTQMTYPASPVTSVNGHTGIIVLGASDVSALSSSLTLSTTAPLSGGGSLSSGLTLSIADATTTSAGSLSSADKVKLNALGSISSQDSDSVAITGGSISNLSSCSFYNIDLGDTSVLIEAENTDDSEGRITVKHSTNQVTTISPSGITTSDDSGGSATLGSDGTLTLSSSLVSANYRNNPGFFVSNGGSALPSASTLIGRRRVEFTGTITDWELIADQSGSVTVTVKVFTYSSTTPSTLSGISPLLSSAAKNSASGLNVSVTEGQWLEFTISGASTINSLSFALKIKPT